MTYLWIALAVLVIELSGVGILTGIYYLFMRKMKLEY